MQLSDIIHEALSSSRNITGLLATLQASGCHENLRLSIEADNERSLRYLSALAREYRTDPELEPRLREFLKLRNAYLMVSELRAADYYHLPHSPVNQLCIKIAEALAKPDEPIIQVLRPSVKIQNYSISADHLMDLTESVGPEGRRFKSEACILNDAGTAVIPILQWFYSRTQDHSFASHLYTDPFGGLLDLTEDELQRLKHSLQPETYDFFDNEQLLIRITSQGSNLAFAVNELCEQLMQSGAGRLGTSLEPHASANDSIISFLKIWDSLSEQVRTNIGSLSDGHGNRFDFHLRILEAGSNYRGRKFSETEFNTIRRTPYANCVQENAGHIKNILQAHRDRFTTIPISTNSLGEAYQVISAPAILKHIEERLDRRGKAIRVLADNPSSNDQDKNRVLAYLPYSGAQHTVNADDPEYWSYLLHVGETNIDIRSVKVLKEALSVCHESQQGSLVRAQKKDYTMDAVYQNEIALAKVISGHWKNTLLHYPITTELASELIRSGALVNARGSLGNSPLHQACSRGDFTLAKFLIGQGADANQHNDLFQTPIELCTKSFELFEYFYAQNLLKYNTVMASGNPMFLELLGLFDWHGRYATKEQRAFCLELLNQASHKELLAQAGRIIKIACGMYDDPILNLMITYNIIKLNDDFFAVYLGYLAGRQGEIQTQVLRKLIQSDQTYLFKPLEVHYLLLIACRVYGTKACIFALIEQLSKDKRLDLSQGNNIFHTLPNCTFEISLPFIDKLMTLEGAEQALNLSSSSGTPLLQAIDSKKFELAVMYIKAGAKIEAQSYESCIKRVYEALVQRGSPGTGKLLMILFQTCPQDLIDAYVNAFPYITRLLIPRFDLESLEFFAGRGTAPFSYATLSALFMIRARDSSRGEVDQSVLDNKIRILEIFVKKGLIFDGSQKSIPHYFTTLLGEFTPELEFVKRSIELGADPGIPNQSGIYPIAYAGIGGPVFHLLLAHPGTRFNAATSKEFYYTFKIASNEGRAEYCAYLPVMIEKGFNLNLTVRSGYLSQEVSLLSLLLTEREITLENLQTLVRHGARLDLRDSQGRSLFAQYLGAVNFCGSELAYPILQYLVRQKIHLLDRKQERPVKIKTIIPITVSQDDLDPDAPRSKFLSQILNYAIQHGLYMKGGNQLDTISQISDEDFYSIKLRYSDIPGICPHVFHQNFSIRPPLHERANSPIPPLNLYCMMVVCVMNPADLYQSRKAEALKLAVKQGPEEMYAALNLPESAPRFFHRAPPAIEHLPITLRESDLNRSRSEPSCFRLFK